MSLGAYDIEVHGSFPAAVDDREDVLGTILDIDLVAACGHVEFWAARDGAEVRIPLPRGQVRRNLCADGCGYHVLSGLPSDPWRLLCR